MGGAQDVRRNNGVRRIQVKQGHEDGHHSEGHPQKSFVLIGVAFFFFDQVLDALSGFGVEGISRLISQAFHLFL